MPLIGRVEDEFEELAALSRVTRARFVGEAEGVPSGLAFGRAGLELIPRELKLAAQRTRKDPLSTPS